MPEPEKSARAPLPQEPGGKPDWIHSTEEKARRRPELVIRDRGGWWSHSSLRQKLSAFGARRQPSQEMNEATLRLVRSIQSVYSLGGRIEIVDGQVQARWDDLTGWQRELLDMARGSDDQEDPMPADLPERAIDQIRRLRQEAVGGMVGDMVDPYEKTLLDDREAATAEQDHGAKAQEPVEPRPARRAPDTRPEGAFTHKVAFGLGDAPFWTACGIDVRLNIHALTRTDWEDVTCKACLRECSVLDTQRFVHHGRFGDERTTCGIVWGGGTVRVDLDWDEVTCQRCLAAVSDARSEPLVHHFETETPNAQPICDAGVLDWLKGSTDWAKVTCPDCLAYDPRVTHKYHHGGASVCGSPGPTGSGYWDSVDCKRCLEIGPGLGGRGITHGWKDSAAGLTLCGRTVSAMMRVSMAPWTEMTCLNCLATPEYQQSAAKAARDEMIGGSSRGPHDMTKVVHYWNLDGKRRWLHDFPTGAYDATRVAADVTCDRCLSELGLQIMGGDFSLVVQEPESERRLSDVDVKSLRPEDVPWRLELDEDENIEPGTAEFRNEKNETVGRITGIDRDLPVVVSPPRQAGKSPFPPPERWRLTHDIWHLTDGPFVASGGPACGALLAYYEQEVRGRRPVSVQATLCPVCEAIAEGRIPSVEDWAETKNKQDYARPLPPPEPGFRCAFCARLDPHVHTPESKRVVRVRAEAEAVELGNAFIQLIHDPCDHARRTCEEILCEGPVVWRKLDPAQVSINGQPQGDNTGCHGNALYWCPTVKEIECPDHGGFDTCCAHPQLHASMDAIEKYLQGELEYIDILFDGPPAPTSGHFIETEDPEGHGIRGGEWVEPDQDAYWRLRIRPEVFRSASPKTRDS